MQFQKSGWDYEDMVNLPHHQSAKRPHMAVQERAAQFLPFAALLTEERPDLDGDRNVSQNAGQNKRIFI